MSAQLFSNNIRRVRKLLHLTPEQLAKKCNCSAQHIYTLERGTQELSELWILKLTRAFNCDKHYLFDDFTDIDFLNRNSANITYTNSIINSNQSNCTNYNNIQKQDNTIININYYQNIMDLSKNQNAIKLDCPVNTLSSLINNQQIQDYSKLVICKDNNETYIVDTANTIPTDKPQLCIIENKIDINNTTCFPAMVRRDVLTNKLIMSIAGQPEMELLKTCSIIGVVLCKTL